MPKVTVLLSVFNGEKYLKEAIESILNQTFEDFEFLIINDCSTDNTLKIIESYDDERIKLINNEINLGLQKNLYKGVEIAGGEYIARMDADDISFPDRLETQVEFMDKKPEIGICGTWVKTLGKNKDFVGKYYSDPKEVKASLLFNTSLAHPTVIIRKKYLVKYNLNYNQDFKESEDYDLWTRCADFFSIANIPKILVYYRYHTESKSNKGRTELNNNSSLIRTRQLKKIGISPNDQELLLHQSLTPPDGTNRYEFINLIETWLLKIIKNNQETKYCEDKALKKVIASRWLLICRNNSNLGLFKIKKFISSPLFKNLDIKNNFFSILKLILYSFFKIS